jgi:hypothetical protein
MQLWEKLNENHARKPAPEFVFPTKIDLSGLRAAVVRMMLKEQAENPAWNPLQPLQPDSAVHRDPRIYTFPHEDADEGTYHFSRERAGFER